jgi:sterol desaturase/sphingolipid hydroxylase (fatty acid hydroxylase superfamily)
MEAIGRLQQYLSPLEVDIARLCVWLVLLIVVFVPLERVWALHHQKVFRKAFHTDLIYFFLNSLAPKIVLILPMTAVAVGLHRLVPSTFYSWVASLPIGIRLLAAMFAGEVGSYWAHRWSHEIPMLWRFHAIHHSAEEIDWLVNSRAHPVDIVFTRFCDMLPMYALGLAQPLGNNVDLIPVLVAVAGTAWGFFIHANVSWRFGWLEWIVSSPAFHHWHHTNDGPELINKNYASMLPVVDKCFGTLYLPKHQWPEKYGIDSSISTKISEQLLQPLTSGRSTSTPAYLVGEPDNLS